MKHLLLFFCAGLFILSSCQKEVSPVDEIISTPPPVVNGTTLKRFVAVDPSLAPPNDTIAIWEFSYDNLNRCSLMVLRDIVDTGTVTTVNYYNGNDTIISSRKINFGDLVSDTAWEYFTYDGNGRMIKDSLIEDFGNGTNEFVSRYTIIDGNFITAKIDFVPNPDSATYTLTRNSFQDITREIDSNYNSYPGQGYSFRVAVNNVITYDANPNPFFKIFPKRLINLEYENALSEDVPFYFMIQQSRNITSEVRTVSQPNGLGTCDNSYTYHYNADGYPVDMLKQDHEDNKAYKGFYFY